MHLTSSNISVSPQKPTAIPFVPKSNDVYLIKYAHAPYPQPIPFSKQDFAALGDIRELLPAGRLPGNEPDFLVVCRDECLSLSGWYGLRIHRQILWSKGGSGIREALEIAPKANGFQFGLQHICVVQTVICYFYTGGLYYDVAHLPISETQFLMCLYRSAVNKNLASLADAVYSRLRRPKTQLGNKHDIKATLKIVIHGMIGKRIAGQKRRKEIQEALVERFGEEIWDYLDEEDLAQFFRDSWMFANIMLEAVTEILRRRMADQGIYLDELD